MEHEPENEITITVFRLLVLDLLALFQVLNQGLINILGMTSIRGPDHIAVCVRANTRSQATSSRCPGRTWSALELGDLYSRVVFKLACNTEVLHDVVGLLCELAIDGHRARPPCQTAGRVPP